jgi:hypothetical protein
VLAGVIKVLTVVLGVLTPVLGVLPSVLGVLTGCSAADAVARRRLHRFVLHRRDRCRGSLGCIVGYSGVLPSVLTGYSLPGDSVPPTVSPTNRVRLARARLAVREQRRLKARPRVREHL